MGIRKRVTKIIFLVIFIPILLNFIPVKFAVKLEDAQQNLGRGRYICVTESKYVHDTGWIAKTSFNSHLDRDLAVRLNGSSTLNYLSEKEFDLKWFETENQYLLIGKVERFEEDKDIKVLYADLNVESWKIVYPINRTSYRKYFTPKSYLNIYDFDLRKMISSIF